MELFGLFGLGAAFWSVYLVAAAALLSLAAPILWAWMLIDALLREDRDYPGETPNSRLLWVLLILLVHLTAIAYFFMVYTKKRRSPAAAPQAPMPAMPTAA